MKINLFKVYPFNLSLDIFENEAEAKAIYIDGLLEEINLLKESERTAITLRYEHDSTIKEISKEMGCSPVTVNQLLSKAIRRLRTHHCKPQIRAIPYVDKYAYVQEIETLESENKALKDALKELQHTDEPVVVMAKRISEYRTLMETLVSDLGIGHGIQGNLIRADIRKVRDLKNYSLKELTAIEGIGAKSAQLIIETLDKLGITSETTKVLHKDVR